MGHRAIKSVLIIGGSGFVGSHLALKLRERFKVFATYRRHKIDIPGVTCLPLNALDKERTKRLLYAIAPHHIIFAAGSNNNSLNSTLAKEAERIHSSAAASVCNIGNILQPKFIYLSNSYIFDGRKGDYKESDIVLPSDPLGKIKVAAENYIKGRSLDYVIVRSSPVFGIGNGFNNSFLDELRIALSKKTRLKLSTHEIHSYASVEGLAELISRIVDSGPRNKIFHYGGLTRVSEFEFGQLFAKKFGFDPELITPESGHDAKARPNDYSVNSSQITLNLKIKPLLLEEGLDLIQKQLIPGS